MIVTIQDDVSHAQYRCHGYSSLYSQYITVSKLYAQMQTADGQKYHRPAFGDGIFDPGATVVLSSGAARSMHSAEAPEPDRPSHST